MGSETGSGVPVVPHAAGCRIETTGSARIGLAGGGWMKEAMQTMRRKAKALYAAASNGHVSGDSHTRV